MLKLFFLVFFLSCFNTHEIEDKVLKLSAPTPHNKAPSDAFGKTVLMPGDPKRAQYIAQKFFENPKLVNDVRWVQGYTGTYKGMKISVMASGMGIPSMSIYSTELFAAYNVENIIRVGSAGSINKNLKIRDIVIATGASTNSNYGNTFGLPGTLSAVGSYKIMKKADEATQKLGLEKRAIFGQIFSTDRFYTEENDSDLEWGKMGILAVEMEAYGLYLNAARAGKNALAICTVSDDLVRKEFLPADERQTSFDEMIKLALETALLLE